MIPEKLLRLAAATTALLAAATAFADPLSKNADVDFYRDVLSRDLHGLASRSDGRLVTGPFLTDLEGKAPSELMWCLEPYDGRWLVGGGPGGRVMEVTADLAHGTFASRDIVRIPDVQVFSLKPLSDGSVLVGTSPSGGLYLVRGGKIAARAGLPVDSIFDIALVDSGRKALAATGNPGRIYSVDLAKFAGSGVSEARLTDPKDLASRGVQLFGQVSDRNLRRIVRLADGRIAAGSAPRGNVYLFPPSGGAPYIAQENHDAEVTDLLPDSAGGFYAAIVFSGGEIHPVQANIQVSAEGVLAVVAPTPNPGSPTPQPSSETARQKENTVEILNAAPALERFQGRSTLQWFPGDGFPETLATRTAVAFYRMCRMGDVIVISGGELGEMTGFDLKSRTSLTFAGSTSSQVNALEPVPGQPGRFFAIRNNEPGFTLVDFAGTAQRYAVTKRIDLGAPARLGALRFNRTRDIDEPRMSVSVRTTNGSNESDGWSEWVPMADNDGWRAGVPIARYAEFKVLLPPSAPATAELDHATIYFLTQNHRPQLQDFRVLSPNFAIVVPPEMPAPVVTTVGQLIQSGDHENDRRRSFLGSQIVASPGTRVAFWTVTAPDGDNLVYTFSIRHDGDPDWTDIAVDSPDPYVQFDTLHLKEGTWFTRLVAKEAAPRPEADRLSVTFETDDLVVDHTPPVIEETSARRQAGKLEVTIRGRDALSILDSAEFTLNNGVHEIVEQPADGILDGQEETFVLEIPEAKAAGATSVEVTLYDSAGNGATRRLGL